MQTETLMRPVQRFKTDEGSPICWKCNLCHGAEVQLLDRVRIPGPKCPLWSTLVKTKWYNFDEFIKSVPMENKVPTDMQVLFIGAVEEAFEEARK